MVHLGCTVHGYDHTLDPILKAEVEDAQEPALRENLHLHKKAGNKCFNHGSLVFCLFLGTHIEANCLLRCHCGLHLSPPKKGSLWSLSSSHLRSLNRVCSCIFFLTGHLKEARCNQTRRQLHRSGDGVCQARTPRQGHSRDQGDCKKKKSINNPRTN